MQDSQQPAASLQPGSVDSQSLTAISKRSDTDSQNQAAVNMTPKEREAVIERVKALTFGINERTINASTLGTESNLVLVGRQLPACYAQINLKELHGSDASKGGTPLSEADKALDLAKDLINALFHAAHTCRQSPTKLSASVRGWEFQEGTSGHLGKGCELMLYAVAAGFMVYFRGMGRDVGTVGTQDQRASDVASTKDKIAIKLMKTFCDLLTDDKGRLLAPFVKREILEVIAECCKGSKRAKKIIKENTILISHTIRDRKDFQMLQTLCSLLSKFYARKPNDPAYMKGPTELFEAAKLGKKLTADGLEAWKSMRTDSIASFVRDAPSLVNALTKDDAQLAQVFPLLSLNVNDSDLTLATCIGLLGEQPIFAINERSLTVQIQPMDAPNDNKRYALFEIRLKYISSLDFIKTKKSSEVQIRIVSGICPSGYLAPSDEIDYVSHMTIEAASLQRVKSALQLRHLPSLIDRSSLMRPVEVVRDEEAPPQAAIGGRKTRATTARKKASMADPVEPYDLHDGPSAADGAPIANAPPASNTAARGEELDALVMKETIMSRDNSREEDAEPETKPATPSQSQRIRKPHSNNKIKAVESDADEPTSALTDIAEDEVSDAEPAPTELRRSTRKQQRGVKDPKMLDRHNKPTSVRQGNRIRNTRDKKQRDTQAEEYMNSLTPEPSPPEAQDDEGPREHLPSRKAKRTASDLDRSANEMLIASQSAEADTGARTDKRQKTHHTESVANAAKIQKSKRDSGFDNKRHEAEPRKRDQEDEAPHDDTDYDEDIPGDTKAAAKKRNKKPPGRPVNAAKSASAARQPGQQRQVASSTPKKITTRGATKTVNEKSSTTVTQRSATSEQDVAVSRDERPTTFEAHSKRAIETQKYNTSGKHAPTDTVPGPSMAQLAESKQQTVPSSKIQTLSQLMVQSQEAAPDGGSHIENSTSKTIKHAQQPIGLRSADDRIVPPVQEKDDDTYYRGPDFSFDAADHLDTTFQQPARAFEEESSRHRSVEKLVKQSKSAGAPAMNAAIDDFLSPVAEEHEILRKYTTVVDDSPDRRKVIQDLANDLRAASEAAGNDEVVACSAAHDDMQDHIDLDDGTFPDPLTQLDSDMLSDAELSQTSHLDAVGTTVGGVALQIVEEDAVPADIRVQIGLPTAQEISDQVTEEPAAARVEVQVAKTIVRHTEATAAPPKPVSMIPHREVQPEPVVYAMREATTVIQPAAVPARKSEHPGHVAHDPTMPSGDQTFDDSHPTSHQLPEKRRVPARAEAQPRRQTRPRNGPIHTDLRHEDSEMSGNFARIQTQSRQTYRERPQPVEVAVIKPQPAVKRLAAIPPAATQVRSSTIHVKLANALIAHMTTKRDEFTHEKVRARDSLSKAVEEGLRDAAEMDEHFLQRLVEYSQSLTSAQSVIVAASCKLKESITLGHSHVSAERRGCGELRKHRLDTLKPGLFANMKSLQDVKARRT